MTWTVPLNKKLQIFWDFNIIGNVWDNVSTDLNKIYSTSLVVLRHLMWKSYILYVKILYYSVHTILC